MRRKSFWILFATLSAAETSLRLPALRDPIGPSSPPQQLRLSPGPQPLSSMRVTWVSYDRAGLASSTVEWWPSANASAPRSSALASAATYDAGVGGWNPNGTIFTAVMAGLAPATSYAYRVGPSAAAMTDARTFSLPPAPGADATLRLAFTADQGTIVPFGWAVANRLLQDHLVTGPRFDVIVLGGDLSYATVTPPNDEVEFTWDAFGLQIEPYASTATFVSVVGNHEAPSGTFRLLPDGSPEAIGFASFTARYTDAAAGVAPRFWFSYDFGPLHFVALSTEHDFSPSSPQLAWLEADLAAVDRATTPFVVACLHRPVLSASVLEWADHSPGAKLSASFEPVFKRHGVDVVLSGHIHSYEYTYPVFNGTKLGDYAPGTTVPTFADPAAPVYVCAGTAGALPENTWFDPAPAWSARRMLGNFGYGRISVTSTAFQYDYVGLYGEVLDTFAITKSH